MRIDELHYDLPAHQIAQEPAKQRDASRLLVVRGREPAEGLEHRRFRDLPDLLMPGDLVVINDAKVLPARVQARRDSGGRVELLFVSPQGAASGPVAELPEAVASQRAAARCRQRAELQQGAWPPRWHALVKPSRRVRKGDRLTLADGTELRVVAEGERGERVIELPAGTAVTDLLERHGAMPLPPYIHPQASPARGELDRRRYQTVYAANPGAVAAPTAGLHFTQALVVQLRQRGIELAPLTLHVGPGTFRPVVCERAEDHVMDSERYSIPVETAAAVRRAKAQGRRVIAVGTTVVRSLEHSALVGHDVVAGEGSADLYIRPGFRFRVISAMITNFHLPRSTPILLVAALIGCGRLLDAYRTAVRRDYRFYSYGDAMLALPQRPDSGGSPSGGTGIASPCAAGPDVSATA